MLDKKKAIIWDMDGVIADTARYHFQAWQEVFSQRGATYTEADFKRNFGKRNDTIIGNTLGSGVSPSEIEAIAARKEASFRRRARSNIKPLPGALELIRSLKEHGFSQALGSSAPLENIKLVIQELGIAGSFKAIVSGREVSEGKPNPQVFLLAAKKLGVKPQDCVVIEDSIAGVMAAKRGGMHCLAVTNTHSSAKLARADLIVATLEKVKIDDLERLFIRAQKRSLE